MINDKQQLAAAGECIAERVVGTQHLCIARRIDELEAQVRVMHELLARSRPYISDQADWGRTHEKCLLRDIDAALAVKLTVPAVTVTETIRTAPERIWLQVGDQAGDHDYPFPEHGDGVSWCAEQVMPCEVPYVRADFVGHVPAPAIPEGWQLVPVEVTLPMQHAYFGVIDKNMRRVETDCRFGRYDSAKEAYRAMLAAPSPDSAK